MIKVGPRREMLGFAIVGGTGFLVDAAILTMLSSQMNIYVARAISFAIALTVTWLLNRNFVFRAAKDVKQGKIVEYSKYLVVQASGASVNLAAFSLLIYLYEELKLIPVVPLAFGSALGMLVNYFGARAWVFSAKS